MTPDQLSTSKALVTRQFARSRSTYDRAAIVQNDMAKRLVRRIERVGSGHQFPQVLELGCGTGLLTELLVNRFSISTLTLNDIVPTVADIAQRYQGTQEGLQVHLLEGDMDKIELPAQQDLVISNAVLQWSNDGGRLLDKMLSAVKPGALLAIATFGPDNLEETRQLTGAALEYLSLDAIQTHLAPTADLLECHELTRTIQFDSAYDVLQHLKQTGANALQQRSWSRRCVRELCEAYESRFARGGRVPLTYHPLTVIARRRVEYTT